MSDLRTAVDALMKLIGPPPADTIPDVAGTYNQRVAAVRVALVSPSEPAEGEREAGFREGVAAAAEEVRDMIAVSGDKHAMRGALARVLALAPPTPEPERPAPVEAQSGDAPCDHRMCACPEGCECKRERCPAPSTERREPPAPPTDETKETT